MQRWNQWSRLVLAVVAVVGIATSGAAAVEPLDASSAGKINGYSLRDTAGIPRASKDWADRKGVVSCFLGAECPVARGNAPQMLRLRPMPPGKIVRIHNARLLSADRHGLYYSEAYAFHWHNPMRGYIPLPGITLVEPVEAGIYIATADRTYWLSGSDIAGESALSELLPYGAAEYSSTRINNSLDVAWYSTRGIVIGSRDGQAKNLQESDVATEKARSAATLYREQDGLRLIVSALRGAETTTAAASTYFEAELVRKETML